VNDRGGSKEAPRASWAKERAAQAPPTLPLVEPAQGPSPQSPPPVAMPLFYKDPRPLDPARHGRMSLKTEIDFGFTRQTNAVPLNVTEFNIAARFFPIVFVRAPAPMALAVLGMRKDQNLFVDEFGRWQSGCYVPAYVRRYPFIFFESEGGKRLSLCVDEASNALVAGDTRPLFKNGQPSDAARGAFDFCAAFQREHSLTQAFVKRLVESDLLTTSQARASLKSGEQLALTGFEVVDGKKFNALSDEAFASFRRDSGLAGIYAHLVAQSSWDSLLNLTTGSSSSQ
jgi:SapC